MGPRGSQRGFRGVVRCKNLPKEANREGQRVVRSKYLPKEANKVDNNVPRRPPEGAIWVVLGPF